MSAPGSLGDFCRYALDYEEGCYADDPVRLGALFREYAGIDRTPGIRKTVDQVRSLGIKIQAVPYLDTGGTPVAEAAGVETLLLGAQRRSTSTDELFAESEKTFDLLYDAYREGPART